MRREGASPVDSLATLADTAATLLEAGIAPVAAWTYIAESAEDPLAVMVGRAVARGDTVVGALVNGRDRPPPHVQEARAAFAAVWWVAVESGAPLAACLRACAESFRGQADTERDIAVALAGPQLTAKMVSALPLVGLLFGALMGFDTFGALTGGPVGWGLLVSGATLMGLGAAWSLRLVRGAASTRSSKAIRFDLVAVALTGGVALPIARDLVAEALRRFLPQRPADGSADMIEQVLELSVRAGVPGAGLLRSEANRRRREERSAGQAAAASLAVRLMLPLGLCVLPSFMLLGVAPLVVSIVSSTFTTL